MCLPCIYNQEFKEQPSIFNHCKTLMAHFTALIPPNSLTICNTHLLCSQSTIITASYAMTMHRVITGALTWNSHQELTNIIKSHRFEIYKTRQIIYGLEAMTHMADKCKEFGHSKKYLHDFNSVYTSRYIDTEELPCTYDDIFTEHLPWDDDNASAIETMFKDVMIGLKLNKHVEPVVEPVEEPKPAKTIASSKQITDLQKQVADLKLSGVNKTTKLTKLKKLINKEIATCPICIEGVRNMALACGHVLCDGCVVSIKKCPFCATNIDMCEIRTVYL